MLDIMDMRRDQLRETLQALNETGVPLVSVHDQIYGAAGLSDDKGMFYFIPRLAQIFDLPIDSAIWVFYASLILISAGLGASFFCLLFSSWISRLLAVLGMTAIVLGSTNLFGHADVYVIAVCAILATAPLFLWGWEKKSSGLIIAFIGLVAGYANCLRHHSGTGVIVFVGTAILLHSAISYKKRLVSMALLLAFFLFPHLHFRQLEKERDIFLTQQTGLPQTAPGFPTWHLIFNGFSYLQPNKYGFFYTDENGYGMARRINPTIGYCSDEHYRILKEQVISLVRKDPLFVFQTILAKIGNLVLKVMLYANIGLIFCLRLRPPRAILLGFFLGVVFYSLAGVLVMPLARYVSGMIALASIFCIYMIGLWIDRLKIFKTGAGSFATPSGL